LIGRAWVYGVAAKGEAGVVSVLETMKRELRTSMALIGASRIGDINRAVIES
jgi:L-lactate dehydrogenase (cytochrome)